MIRALHGSLSIVDSLGPYVDGTSLSVRTNHMLQILLVLVAEVFEELSTVKNRWRALYDRLGRVAPELMVDVDSSSEMAVRGQEKRAATRIRASPSRGIAPRTVAGMPEQESEHGGVGGSASNTLLGAYTLLFYMSCAIGRSSRCDGARACHPPARDA